MDGLIELANVENCEYCMLSLESGETKFYKDGKKVSGFTGLYYRNNHVFFAIFPTKKGPEIYYKNRIYPILKSLEIVLNKNGEEREFIIKDYGIKIKYTVSPYIGFDVWSNERDVDLFYQIKESYRDDKYYELFTLNN